MKKLLGISLTLGVVTMAMALSSFSKTFVDTYKVGAGSTEPTANGTVIWLPDTDLARHRTAHDHDHAPERLRDHDLYDGSHDRMGPRSGLDRLSASGKA